MKAPRSMSGTKEGLNNVTLYYLCGQSSAGPVKFFGSFLSPVSAQRRAQPWCGRWRHFPWPPLPRLHPHGARHPHVRRQGPVGPGHVLPVLLWHLCRGVPALSLRDCLLRIPGELPKLLRKPVGSFRVSNRPGVTFQLFLAGEVGVAVREGPGHTHRTWHRTSWYTTHTHTHTRRHTHSWPHLPNELFRASYLTKKAQALYVETHAVTLKI